MKINGKAFGLTCGIFWGLSVLVMTWWVVLVSGPQDIVVRIFSIYPGYSLTLVGSLIGFVWGFIDAFIGGIIFAWLYNKLSTKCVQKT